MEATLEPETKPSRSPKRFVAPVADTETPAPRRKKRLSPRVHKFIRRAHLYLGLALVPWVLLFGVSGFLFNHNSTFFGGSANEVATFSSSESAGLAGIAALEIDQLAQEIVEKINSANADQTESNLSLVDPGSVRVTAHQRFQGRGSDGNVTVAIDLTDGSAVVTTQQNDRPDQTTPPFSGQTVATAGFDLDALGNQAGKLLDAAGIEIEGELNPGRRGPELQFQLIDENGRKWNTVYALNSGQLSGRAADDDTGLNFRSAVTRLHKTHNYPDHVSARWIWVMIADVTALTLVFWGVSGLIMWWKMGPTKVIGTIAISVAVIIAAMIFSATLSEFTFAGSPGSNSRSTPVRNEKPASSESSEQMERPGAELKSE